MVSWFQPNKSKLHSPPQEEPRFGYPWLLYTRTEYRDTEFPHVHSSYVPHVVHSFPQCKYSSEVESYSSASRILDGSQVIYSLIIQISHIILYQKDKDKIHFIKNV